MAPGKSFRSALRLAFLKWKCFHQMLNYSTAKSNLNLPLALVRVCKVELNRANCKAAFGLLLFLNARLKNVRNIFVMDLI